MASLVRYMIGGWALSLGELMRLRERGIGAHRGSRVAQIDSYDKKTRRIVLTFKGRFRLITSLVSNSSSKSTYLAPPAKSSSSFLRL